MFFFCLWQEEEWDGRMEDKDKRNSMEGRKQAGQDQVEREGMKGGWDSVRRDEGQRMKEGKSSKEGR